MSRWALPFAFLALSAWYAVSAAPELEKPYVAWSLEGTRWTDGSSARAFDETFARLSPFEQNARDLTGFARYAAFAETRKGAIMGEDGWFYNVADFSIPSNFDRQLAEVVDNIVDVRRRAEAAGMDLIFVPLPIKADIERQHHNRKGYAERAEQFYRALVRSVKSEGVVTVDARDVMLGKRDHGPIMYRTDQHWTPLATQAVAAEIAELVGSDTSSRYKARTSLPATFRGDLTSLIGSDELRTALGVKLEVVEGIEALPVSSEQQRVPTRVVLAGTSASADPRWGFSDNLILALQEPVSNYSYSGFGPYFALERLPGNLALAGERPSTLIWEFPVNAVFIPGQVDYAPLP